MKANKFLGQNFLINESKIVEIVDKSKITNQIVVEVGPGKGAITIPICQKAKKVYAIETDSRMIELLETKKIKNLSLINSDVLEFDFESFFKQNKIDDCVFVSNLPYYIASPIIFKVIMFTKFNRLAIMLQKEMAERITAKNNTRSFGRLTVAINTYFEVKEQIPVPANCFAPKPKVDSTFLVLKRKENLTIDLNYLDFIKVCFSLKRKTILNSTKSNKKYHDAIEKWINKENKSKTIRAEQITTNEFLTIFNSLKD